MKITTIILFLTIIRPTPFSILPGLIGIVRNQALSFPSLSVQGTSIINQETTIEISFTTGLGLVATNYILFTIPPTVSFNTNTPGCSVVSGGFNLASPCEVQPGGRDLKMTLISDSDFPIVLIQISNFVNPPSTKALTGFKFTTFDKNNQQLEVSSTIELRGITPDQLTTSTMVPQNQEVGKTGQQVRVSLQPKNEVPANGQIYIQFPFWFDDPTAPIHYFPSGSTCATVSGLKNGISCTYDQNSRAMTVNNILDAPSTSEMVFTIDGFSNPISTGQTAGFTIRTMDNAGGFIDSSNVQVEVTQPAKITIANIQPLGSKVVGEPTIMNIIIQNPVPLQKDCQIRIVFPEEIPISINELAVVQGSGFIQKDNQDFTTKDPVTRTVKFGGCQNIAGANQVGFARLSQIRNPGMKKDSQSVKIYILNNKDSVIAEITSGIVIQAKDLTTGSIFDYSAEPSNSEVQQSSSYTVQFKPAHFLPNNAKLQVTFANTVQLSNPCGLSNFNGIDSGVNCNFNNAANRIELTNPFGGSGTYTPATGFLLRFDVPGGTNPMVSGDAGEFIFETFVVDADGEHAVDKYQGGNTLIIEPGNLKPSLRVIPGDFLAYNQPITYEFQFKTKNVVPKDGTLIIVMPTISGVTISDINLAQNNCVNGAGLQTSQLQCNFEITDGRIIVRDGVANSNLPGETQITFTVQGLRNPRSKSTTESFRMFTADQNEKIIDQVISGQGVTMTSVMNLDSVTVIPESSVCGESTSYVVEVQVKTPVRNGDKFKLTFPSDITLPNLADLSCTPGTQLAQVTCGKSGLTIIATLTQVNGGEIPETDVFTFKINNIKNPNSTKKTSSLVAKVVDSQDGDINTYDKDIILQMTTPAPIQSSSLVQGTDKASEWTDYKIRFTTISQIPAGGAIQIDYPPAIRIDDSGDKRVSVKGLEGITGDFAYSHDPGIRRIIITGAFSSSFPAGGRIGLNLNPVRNPQEANQDPMRLTTLINPVDDFRIDQTGDDQLIPTLECFFPCKTCPTNDKGKCLSCYTTSDFPKFDSENNQCLEKCPAGYVSEGGSLCVKCNSNCLTCEENDRNKCSTCDIGGATPKIFNGVCYDDCPNISFKVGDICQACVEPCGTCKDASTCLSCAQTPSNPNRFFFNGECQTSCPTDQTSIGGFCQPCQAPCSTCSGSTSSCTGCQGIGLLFQSSCVQACPENAIQIESRCVSCNSKCGTCAGDPETCVTCTGGLYMMEGECIETCPEGFISNDDTGKCESGGGGGQIYDYTIVPFPFLIMALICFLVALGGKFKDSRSLILSNLIVLWAFIEFLAYPSMAIFALMVDSIPAAGAAFAAFVLLIAQNISFTCYYRKVIVKDEYFNEWRTQDFRKTSKCIVGLSTVFSFKIMRLFYSRFFGLEHFTGRFLRPDTFYRPITCVSIANFVFVYGLIIMMDILILVFQVWGTQLYICAIETLLITIIMIIITIIEFKTAKVYDFDNPGYRKLTHGNLESAADLEKQMRIDLLRKIGNQIGPKNPFDPSATRGIENCVLNKKLRRTNSMGGRLNQIDMEEDPRKIRSYPLSPKTKKELAPDTDSDDAAFDYPNNVYADSKTANPGARRGKRFATVEIQTGLDKDMRRGQDMYSSDDRRDKQTKDKGRGRKNKYYSQIDEEDDEEARIGRENLSDSDLDVIMEVDEKKRRGRGRGTARKRPGDESDYDDAIIEDPELEKGCVIPPDLTFNENDILGDFDRDDRGRIILVTNERGKLVDKKGRRVNEKGYLLDRHHGLIETRTRKKMFPKAEVDERGEVPAPFSLHKHGYNPFDCMGHFSKDEYGNPILQKGEKKGQLLDDNGKKVNKHGWLVDDKGNVIERHGRKRFDKKQLTSNGDIPRQFTYEATKFDIRDVMGDVDPDDIEDAKVNGTNLVNDRQGRKINNRGYLVNGSGDVVDKNGNVVFKSGHIHEDEIPKIFVFSKFNIEQILGEGIERDPKGNVIGGATQDNKQRPVNKKGYLINPTGDVITNENKVMFKKNELEDDDIPKIFRTGLIRSDSTTSISKLLEHQNPNQTSDDETLIQNELKKLKTAKSGGNTSVESGMEESPAHYDMMNQRIPVKDGDNHGALRDDDDEDSYGDEELDDLDDLSGGELDGATRRRRAKKRRKGAKKVYKDPNEKDVLMARAYGGVPRGAMVRKGPRSRVQTSTSTLKIKGNDKERLSKLAGSVTGFGRDSDVQSQRSTSRRRDSPEVRLGGARTEVGQQTQNVPKSGNFMMTDTFDNNTSTGNEVTNISNMEQPVGPSGEGSVPVQEHHIREQKLKQQKLQEIRRKKKRQKQLRSHLRTESSELEKIYSKDIDDFLEDSDWDIESLAPSNMSRNTSRTQAQIEGRLRGLESIYLQRIDTTMGKPRKKGRSQSRKPKFRRCQDRVMDDPAYLAEDVETRDDISNIIDDARMKKMGALSARSPGKMQQTVGTNGGGSGTDDGQPNIFTGNWKAYKENENSPSVDLTKKYIN